MVLGHKIDRSCFDNLDFILLIFSKISLLKSTIELNSNENMYDHFLRKKETIINYLKFNNVEKIDFLQLLKKIKQMKNNIYCHGDLNLDNILLDEKGDILIIDFEEVVISNKYHDICILLSNWDIELDIIKSFSKIFDLNWHLVVEIAII